MLEAVASGKQERGVRRSGEAQIVFILSLGENDVIFKCMFLCCRNKNKEEQVPPPPARGVPTSLRAGAGGLGAAPACRGVGQPFFSARQGGGRQQQAPGVREEAAGGAAARRAAGAAPGEDAPGAGEDVGLSEGGFQEQNR